MGVVIVQSKATAHVYRMFGALVALLLMMAVAVGVMRLRIDRAMSSPYGALGAVAPVAALPPQIVAVPARVAAQTTPPAVAMAIAAAAPPPPAPRVLAYAPATASPPAVAAPPPAAAVTLPAPSPSPAPVAATAAAPSPVPAAAAPSPAPVAALTPVPDAPPPPRSIALDKAAARSATPQPAPQAAVEAATRAAAAAPVVETRRVVTASARPTDPAGADDTVEAGPARGSSGRININTASIDQLNNIPGGGRIGRSIARHRPYRSLEDLVEHRVLKARDFARIRAAISTN